MDNDFLRNLIIWLLVIMAQVLICDHIMLFGVAIAFVYIYIIIRLPMSLNVNYLLSIAFLSGLTVDIFSDTPGVNSLACTVLAMLKRGVMYAYVPRDDRTKAIMPTLRSLGFVVYGKYLFSMCAIYCILVFSIEYFNFADVKDIVIMSGSSAVLSFFLLLGIDSIIMTKREKRL